MQLLDLPPELVVQSLCYLDLPDLVSVSKTNSVIRSYTQTFQILQYRFATQAAGVEDNPHCNLVIAERLAQLQGREEGWSKLEFDFRKTIPARHSSSGIYDMTAGIYFLDDASRRALHYCRLPSAPSDPVEWARIDIDRTLVDIGLAIYEHDLIAVVTSTAHQEHFVIEVLLLQFSTGKPHPLARHPVLFIAETSWPNPSICVEIVGRHLALVTNHVPNPFNPRDHFYIFDWTAGVLKMKITAVHHTYSGIVFLSPDLVLLPNTHGLPTLDIWAIPSSNAADAPILPLLSLGLPAISSDYFIMTLTCRGEPNPSQHGTPHARTPSLSVAADALVIFNICVQHIDLALHHGNNFSMFTRRSILLGLARDTLEKTTKERTLVPYLITGEPVLPQRESVFVPWDVWGAQNTRWVDAEDTTTQWITTSAGQRCVISTEEAVPLAVLDFNPLMVRRLLAEQRRGAEGGRQVVVTALSAIEHEAFEEPLEGSLPYVSLAFPEPPEGGGFGFAGVLMDEERLLGLRTDEDDNVLEIEVMHMGPAAD